MLIRVTLVDVTWHFDDFDRFLNNSCNLGKLLAKISQIVKNNCFVKVKIEDKKMFFLIV